MEGNRVALLRVCLPAKRSTTALLRCQYPRGRHLVLAAGSPSDGQAIGRTYSQEGIHDRYVPNADVDVAIEAGKKRKCYWYDSCREACVCPSVRHLDQAESGLLARLAAWAFVLAAVQKLQSERPGVRARPAYARTAQELAEQSTAMQTMTASAKRRVRFGYRLLATRRIEAIAVRNLAATRELRNRPDKDAVMNRGPSGELAAVGSV